MQYHYKFNISTGNTYTIVATGYAQASKTFKKFWAGSYVCTSLGLYKGPVVKNKTVVLITR